ncbi:phenylacetyl-CoA ligase [Colletotrichum tofieldiae]|uniref:Phenylacetyl-CoA ligase n=1 Tax=Colletotrichum tofieldiae TaxID=708197 RepID=A0A166NII2_9PEZI|nr:phenylacetyl-CoA ligase [Colletotrichum tofieldiae]
MVQALLRIETLSPDAKGQHRWTPLMEAARDDRVNIVRTLLSSANVNISNTHKNGKTALWHAEMRKHQNIIRFSSTMTGPLPLRLIQPGGACRRALYRNTHALEDGHEKGAANGVTPRGPVAIAGGQRPYGRHPKADLKPPFTCGITGKAYSLAEVLEQIELLARALASDLGWQINTLTDSWATHRLSGVSCPTSSSCSQLELTNLIKAVNYKALFTCTPLLDQTLDAAAAVGIPSRHVYLLDLPPQLDRDTPVLLSTKSVDRLIKEAHSMTPIPLLRWSKGQGARQEAFICASSGTSGLLFATYDGISNRRETEMGLGVLPLSHGYVLYTISFVSVYRGDGVVILQSFDLFQTLEAVEKYSLRRLWLIPSMITAITKAISLVNRYDLSSVRTVVTAASPLKQETSALFSQLFPNCSLIQAYGLTEVSVMLTLTDMDDMMHGSSGCLLPAVEARLVDRGGSDIHEYHRAGELWVRTPGIMLDYLNNEEATREMITKDGWLRTGDLVEIRLSPKGNEHVFIVDGIKELIKVGVSRRPERPTRTRITHKTFSNSTQGMQVAPAEMESFHMLHAVVADAAVIPVPSETAGELPLAYIVMSPLAKHQDESAVREELYNHVKEALSQYKHLDGGIELTDSVPKTISGKTKRAILKERAKTLVRERNALAEVASGWREMAEYEESTMIQVLDFDSDSDKDY